MASYDTGTVSVTGGSATVTGSGTAFVANVQPGWLFIGPDGFPISVAAVVSDTSITLSRNYQGSTASGQSYEIVPTTSLTLDLVATVQALITDYGDIHDTIGQARVPAGDDLVAEDDLDTGLGWTGTNQLSLLAGGTARLTVTGNTASGTVVQSSLTDTTVGRLMKNGAFGWGLNDTTAHAIPSNDADALTTNGLWLYDSSTVGRPDANGLLVHMVRRGSAAGGTSGKQIQQAFSATGEIWTRAYADPGGWGDWVQLAIADADGNLIVAGDYITIGGNEIGGVQFTLADDAVVSITPPRLGGFARITCAGNSSSPNAAWSGEIWFDCGATPAIEKGTAFAGLGAQLDVTTSNLTGTSGTDTNVTVAARDTGVLRVENRAGSSKDFQITFL